MNIIKQYGLERSGTNYIKALLEHNLEDTRVLSNMFGLKHEKYVAINPLKYNPFKDKNVITDLNIESVNSIKDKFVNDEIYYIVILKNPHSWLVSYNKCKWIKNNNGPLKPPKIRRLMERWNSVNKDWIDNLLKIKKEKSVGIIYEDLLLDPQKMIKDISIKFNIPMNDSFIPITKEMHPGVDRRSIKNISKKPFNRKEYYLNKNYKEKLPPKFLTLIDALTNKEILQYFENE